MKLLLNFDVRLAYRLLVCYPMLKAKVRAIYFAVKYLVNRKIYPDDNILDYSDSYVVIKSFANVISALNFIHKCCLFRRELVGF